MWIAEGMVMSAESKSAPPSINRRASRRLPLRSSVRIECRKDSLGLGPNLATSAVDLSETGVRLVLKAPLEKGQEVEILIGCQGHGQFVKRLGNVMWSQAVPTGAYAVGVHFQKALAFLDYQNVTRPLQVLS
jgi:hypothetical protein